MSFTPPASVAKAAKKGLALRKKYGRGGTKIGITRAHQLANQRPVSSTTIDRMVAFFNRHEKNKDTPPEKGNGMIAWYLWGGDPGRKWAEKVQTSMKKNPPTKPRVAEIIHHLSTEGYQDLDLSTESGWYALFEDPLTPTNAFVVAEDIGLHPLTDQECKYLTKSAGFIVSEDDEGLVTVTAYETKRELYDDWDDIEQSYEEE